MSSKLSQLCDKYQAVVFFDTETTGLDPSVDQIIELAAVRITRNQAGFLVLDEKMDACDYIDSLTVYKDRAAYPHKLANAIEHYSLEGKVKNSHRAIDDVLALYCVTYAMAEERMDLEQYVNIFGYNNRYGIMEPKLEKVTYHAQSYNNYITDDRATLPAIIRTENGEGDQLTLDAFYEKEAAGHGTEPGL